MKMNLRILSMEREGTVPKYPVIAVVTDPKLKEQLRDEVDDFRFSVMKKKIKKFGPDVSGDLVSIDEDLDQFYRDKLPTSRDLLEQIIQDVVVLQSIFSNKPKHPLGSDASKQLNLIKTDLRVKVDAVKQGNPEVDVTVETRRNGIETSGFTVCYAPELMYKANQCDLSFPEPSSPTHTPLGIATYFFWAIKPGDNSAISDVRRMPVRWQGGHFSPVGLTILK